MDAGGAVGVAAPGVVPDEVRREVVAEEHAAGRDGIALQANRAEGRVSCPVAAHVDGAGEGLRRKHGRAGLAEGGVEPVGVRGLEHEAVEAGGPVQHVGAVGAGLDAEQLDVVGAEDGEVVAGPERVVATGGELEAKAGPEGGGLVEPVPDVDDDVVDEGDGKGHAACRAPGRE